MKTRRHPVAPRTLVLAGLLAAAGLIGNPWLLAWLLRAAHPGLMSILLLLAIDVALLAAAAGLASGRLRPRHLLFIAITGAASILLLEATARLFFFVHGLMTPVDRTITAEGWATVADEHILHVLPGFGGVDYRTGRGGFRPFGDLDTTRTRLLVLGDSYTQGFTVSAGEMYAERIAADRPDVELWAYGCGGYGTLQEEMVLEKWFDTIHPSLILWQFCGNDLINNDLELESASTLNNNQMRRPYWIGGKIVEAFPYQHLGPAYWFVQHSTLLKLLKIQLNSLKSPGVSIEAQLGPDDPRLQRSIATTRAIMALARKRVGKIPIAAFCVDRVPWAPDAFETICKEEGIVWLSGVPETIAAARETGKQVDGQPFDTHWNAAGHAIAAEVLERDLVRNKLLPRL